MLQTRTALPGPMLRFLDPDGNVVPGTSPPDLTPEHLRQLYRWMLYGRVMEGRGILLQRQGRLGVFAPIAGQEAAYVGSAMAIRPEDWVVPSYRDYLPALVHGLPLQTVWFYYRGDPRGTWIPPHVRMLPFQVVVAAQVSHAVGVAWAIAYRREPSVVLVYFGEGATSEGEWHESLNAAAVFRLPVVFFCSNNQWAISVPLQRQTASETIAQKAVAYGMPGVLVDGNDVLAVYQATAEAVDRARRGDGPTLIEAVTYRLGAHSTVDDPRRYRSEEEVEAWRPRDPLKRFRAFLEARGLLTPEESEAWRQDLEAGILAEFEETWKAPPPDPEWMLTRLYASPPRALASQLEELRRAVRAPHDG